MPFEPNLIHSEDDDDRDLADTDWELPEALASLGEQLGKDAARLADTYPAHRADVWPRDTVVSEGPRSAHYGHTAWLGYAAAGLVLAVGSMAWVWSDFGRTAMAPPPPTRASVVVEATPARFAPAAEDDSLMVPSRFFQTLTGPEQEALLDLIEIQNLEQASLSI